VDPTGKLAGRGAYLCRDRACWTRGLSQGRLSAALKTTLTSDEMAALRAFAAELPETEVVGVETGPDDAGPEHTATSPA
jgi:hypothetical protein